MTDRVNEAVAWIRFCSDGGIEGPILDSDRRMDGRRESGAWTPLYTHPARGVEDEVLKGVERTIRWREQEVERLRNEAIQVSTTIESRGRHETALDDLYSIRAALQAAALPAVPPDDDNMVVIETVGFVRENAEGDRCIDWTIEGGIHELEIGEVINVSSQRVTNDEGYGELYRRPQSALPADHTTEARTLEAVRAKLSPSEWAILCVAFQDHHAAAASKVHAALPAVPDGISLIAAERQRQITAEGWTLEHDDEHGEGELAKAAAVYAMPRDVRPPIFWSLWPWHDSWWKPGDRIRELVKAGALIVAEIERLKRATPAHDQPEGSDNG